MTKSMTGFYNGSMKIDKINNISVEMRSVNNRYFDFNLRIDDDLKYLETKIKTLVGVVVKRGKVDLRVSRVTDINNEKKLSDEQILTAVKDMKRISSLSKQEFKASSMEIINFINYYQSSEKQKINEKKLMDFLSDALENFNKDRKREGSVLGKILLKNAKEISKKTKQIKSYFSSDAKQYQKKLMEKLEGLNVEVTDQRLQQEVIFFLQKSDIQEEIDRLFSHLIEIENLLRSNEAVGKKLDFMMQELNREANTLASKSISNRISSEAIDIKVLIEQMREQIQNIE